jgi:hypothetical protein
MIELSYSEATALATKAARGAGHHWGVAEEAAIATSWLCAAGYDGLKHLHRAMTHIDTPACPLKVGIQILDFARIKTGAIDQNTVFLAIKEPIFALPFAVQAAKIRQQNLTFLVDHHAISIDAHGHVNGIGSVQDIAQASLKVVPAHTKAIYNKTHPNRRVFTQFDTFDALTSLAHMTYVPATEASRAAGAGAGTSDND